MRFLSVVWVAGILVLPHLLAASPWDVFTNDPDQKLERTCFQTGRGYSEKSNLRSDVAIVYGIDPKLPERIQTWRDHGYRIHVMTGVSWGEYQDYLYGRFDGINHEDEAQTSRDGTKISHGGDVYYMCPGTNFGKFLCVGVQRALDAEAEAIHLEEPEFWVRAGYSEGFKREWKSHFNEEWQAPHSSVDAQWRASKLKYFLYRRALQQVFDHIQEYNRRTGRNVRCYVPTHSLINYAHWGIVSPESSLARLQGCDGYIAQVWTGTSRTRNVYRGNLRERTFETAFLEYGAMQNLVRATGRKVWYLNDPIEDNPNYDWEDYRVNWESTLTASLFQPEVWQFEVAPWPERIFGGKYPSKAPDAKGIPPAYATELQTVMNTLNDMKQNRVEWDCGTTGIGVIIGDSLMFQRSNPTPSDKHMSHLYGLALPLLKRGMPVTPVQLENLTIPKYLDGFRMILLTYQGMKPLSPDVHAPLADWVRRGGLLVVCDDDSDPYNTVREWWNSNGLHYATPRLHLFEQLGLDTKTGVTAETPVKVGKGSVVWIRQNPAAIAASPTGSDSLMAVLRPATKLARLAWRETNYLLLRRGPYLIASGLDESGEGEPKILKGRFINLFDPKLQLQKTVTLAPSTRLFLRDLDFNRKGPTVVLASAGKALPVNQDKTSLTLVVEAVANTPGVVLLSAPGAPRTITLAGQAVNDYEYSPAEKLLWIRFPNASTPRELAVRF
jgi:hypothetical protein